MKLSEKGQTLWDEFGDAYDRHYAASSQRGVPSDERGKAARAYLVASRKLHNYIATLERKVAKSKRA